MAHAITPVWHKLNSVLEEELVDFWLEEKVFASDVPARDRTREVVCIARGADGRIAGVCSAVTKIVPRLRERLYYYRSYVRPADRRSEVAINLLHAAKKLLQAHEAGLDKPQCIGIVIELENRQLAAHLNDARWTATEFSFIGYSPRGYDMRVWYFPEAKLQRLRLRRPAKTASRSARSVGARPVARMPPA
jgi:hypothetical protein